MDEIIAMFVSAVSGRSVSLLCLGVSQLWLFTDKEVYRTPIFHCVRFLVAPPSIQYVDVEILSLCSAKHKCYLRKLPHTVMEIVINVFSLKT